MTTALLLVDLQNDFVQGGALEVSEGLDVIPIANRLIDQHELVVATQDFHPADHLSFASQHGKPVGTEIELSGLTQVLWPDHCVQGTRGADLVESLNQERINHIATKGTDREIDSYSGFFDNGKRKATGLHDWLQDRGVDRLVVMGLATDFCVKFTVLDALDLGYQTTLVADGCRGVELNDGDIESALSEMQARGAIVK